MYVHRPLLIVLSVLYLLSIFLVILGMMSGVILRHHSSSGSAVTGILLMQAWHPYVVQDVGVTTWCVSDKSGRILPPFIVIDVSTTAYTSPTTYTSSSSHNYGYGP